MGARRVKPTRRRAARANGAVGLRQVIVGTECISDGFRGQPDDDLVPFCHPAVEDAEPDERQRPSSLALRVPLQILRV